MTEGIVYVLTNEAMPGYVKIGITASSVADRIRTLDNTSLPYPFECYYAALVPDMELAERLIHDAFADVRVSRRREFFTIDPERVRSALQLAAIEDVTPREDEIVEDVEDRAAIGRARQRRQNANFPMLGIEPGTVLSFSKAPHITCIVVDDKRVEFEGEVLSVSRSALEVVRRLGYDWTAVNGWSYWRHDGRVLSDLWRETLDED